MPYSSENYVLLSGLQHLIYCRRQAALIHVEQVWEEDDATLAGRLLHERAHLPGIDHRGNVKVERSVMLWCDRLGVRGRSDIVEYRQGPQKHSDWIPYPVEYKRGRLKKELADQVQLCAQALCLEEMHQLPVKMGALFYGKSHKRLPVSFDDKLRKITEETILEFHKMIAHRVVPAPVPGPKCRRCSLLNICLPYALAHRKKASSYLQRLLQREEIE